MLLLTPSLVEQESEVVIEITLTWRHLLALAALVVAVSLLVVYYSQLKLAAVSLLGIPLAEVKLDAETYKPGSTMRVEVCPIAELKGEELRVLVVDPKGEVAYTVVFRAEEGCTALEVLLKSDSPAGTYTVVVRSRERALAAKRFEVLPG
jgi:hypothetical protein